MILELLEVEMSLVTDRYAVADYIGCLGEGREIQIVGYVDCFIVDTLNNLAMEREGRKIDFKTDDVAFAEGGIVWRKVCRSRHVDSLAGDITESIAVSIKAERSIQTCFATCPTYTNMATFIQCRFSVLVVIQRPDATEYFAFPIPSAFSSSNICPRHPEPFLGRDGFPFDIEKDMRGGIFEVETRTIWFCFGRTMVLRGWKGRIGNTVDIAKSLAIVDTKP